MKHAGPLTVLLGLTLVAHAQEPACYPYEVGPDVWPWLKVWYRS